MGWTARGWTREIHPAHRLRYFADMTIKAGQTTLQMDTRGGRENPAYNSPRLVWMEKEAGGIGNRWHFFYLPDLTPTRERDLLPHSRHMALELLYEEVAGVWGWRWEHLALRVHRLLLRGWTVHLGTYSLWHHADHAPWWFQIRDEEGNVNGLLPWGVVELVCYARQAGQGIWAEMHGRRCITVLE